MCLLLLAIQAHPAYPLIIAGNRDEFYERPASQAGFWKDHPEILAGRDLQAGGAWFGMTPKGRIAALTNYRDPASINPHAPSRGRLVTDFLIGEETPEVYLAALSRRPETFNGFNLTVGVKDHLCWYSNRGNGIYPIQPGIHGLSNHLLNTPWPKVSRARAALAGMLSEEAPPSLDALFELLADRTVSDDDHLPDTGVGIEWERILSPVFITSPAYGTRCSSVLVIDQNNRAIFAERTYLSPPDPHKDVTFEFMLEG